MEDNKYSKFFDYLTVDDIKSISENVTMSESTIRKYLKGEFPDTDLAKAKLDKIVESAIEILKGKSQEILEMIENV